MITDEELEQLPEDPELAFIKFERTIRAGVYQAEGQAEFREISIESTQLDYINRVVAAGGAFGITAVAQLEVPHVGDHITRAYEQFTLEVDHITTQLRIRHATRNRQNSVGLDGNTKAKIHHHIEQIRATIEKADLPEQKRDSLYTNLNRFALEVDKNRTSLQSGMAVYIAVCDGIGQGFMKLEPARKMFDAIGTLLGRVKEVEDALRPTLSRPEGRKQLEAPHGEPDRSRPRRTNQEDEMPF